MKTCLLVLCLIAAAASSVVAETYRAPVIRQRHKPQPREKARPLARQPVDGVIPRGIRGGNFLQMFNPKAPAKYGTSQEAIVYDPAPMNSVPAQNGQNDPGKWKGIKFFVFRF